jgi:eukaryotic-like serine/threonine-protein kinase
MATGRQPFTGNTSAIIFDAILNKPPTAPVRINPDLPAGLEAVINKCLEKERNLRYQTASDLRADLQRLKRDTQSAKVAAVSGSSVAVASTPGAKSKWPMFAALGGLLAVIVLGAVGYFAGWFGSAQPYSQAQLKPQQLTANSSDDPVSVTSISPDGKYLLYADLEGLHLRLMATGETQSLPIPDEFCFR